MSGGVELLFLQPNLETRPMFRGSWKIISVNNTPLELFSSWLSEHLSNYAITSCLDHSPRITRLNFHLPWSTLHISRSLASYSASKLSICLGPFFIFLDLSNPHPRHTLCNAQCSLWCSLSEPATIATSLCLCSRCYGAYTRWQLLCMPQAADTHLPIDVYRYSRRWHLWCCLELIINFFYNAGCHNILFGVLSESYQGSCLQLWSSCSDEISYYRLSDIVEHK
jgi:hypothetical protein